MKPSSVLQLPLDLYRAMIRIRIAEQRVVELYPSDKIQSPIHLSIGQEAVSAGVCLALEKTDHVYGTYRGHGPYIAKGGDLRRMFAELYGKDTGCARGKGGSMHLVAPEVGLMGCSAIVASTIPVATGDALAAKVQKKPRVTVALFGDGGVDEGVFFESVNFALLKRLPIVYVLENNLYAIHSRVEDRHKQTELFRLTDGLGLPGTRYNGNDASLVHRTMKEAAEQARAGNGPVLVEYMTYRWREHVGPGNDFKEKYREPGEEQRAEAADPIAITREELLALGATVEQIAAIDRQTRDEVDAAVRFAEESGFPGPDRLMADLYA